MDIRNGKLLRQKAEERLDYAAYDPKKLTLLHGAVMVGVSLVLALLSLLIAYGVAGTGGLSGIGTRNILQTIESVLNLAYVVATPFWQIGILFSFMCIVRRKAADNSTLLKGFQRMGPVFSLMFLQLVLYFLLAMACAYVSSFVSMMFSSKLVAMLEPVVLAMEQDPNADMYALMMQLPMKDLLVAMIPMLVIFGVTCLVVMLFVSYRLRFAQYLVLDDPRMGGLAAMRQSFRLTKGHCMSLFKLDLSFWKYYLLQVLAVVLYDGAMLLPLFGVNLPMPSEWQALIFYGVYGVMVLSLAYWMRPKVEATFALAYETVKNPPLAVYEMM